MSEVFKLGSLFCGGGILEATDFSSGVASYLYGRKEFKN